jgi:flagellar biosynthesis GTPase FlhF
MKMRIPKVCVLIALLFLRTYDCQSAELRTVNGKEIDLQPLIDWAAHKKGERPLKHWKLVQILENKGQTAYPIVMADIEGAKTQIALKNCPSGILQLLAQKQTLEAQLSEVRQEHQAAAQDAANTRKRKEVKQAKRSEAAAADMEKNIKKELAELEKKIKQQKAVYAMSTGGTFNGLPVWDTGLPSH